jgi:hypothetical protein
LKTSIAQSGKAALSDALEGNRSLCELVLATKPGPEIGKLLECDRRDNPGHGHQLAKLT